MTFLLDVNVLIALIDPAHVGHDRAHAWFGREGSAHWATCPITQNGVIRIVGHPNYPNSPGPPSIVGGMMRELTRLPGHEFWADAISLLDEASVRIEAVLTRGQVTDTYLLALAASKGGKLATFDRRLSASAAQGGQDALFVIPSAA